MKVFKKVTFLYIRDLFQHFKLFPWHCCCCLVILNSFVTPWTVAHQAPLSMGFPRQEYWNGLPFPFPGDLLNPGIEVRSPTLWADSLPLDPPEKSKNAGVGSLSPLQGIFLTQESNWSLLHCRWILYQLNCPGRLVLTFVTC